MKPGGQTESLGATGTTLLWVLLCCLAGCWTTTSQIPSWIDRPPVDQAYLYAIGTYVGSLYPEDNRKNAHKDAIGRLSWQIRTHVVDRVQVTQGASSSTLKRKTDLNADNLVEISEVLEWWVDQDGQVQSGLPGTVYCLVRAPMDKVLQMLNR